LGIVVFRFSFPAVLLDFLFAQALAWRRGDGAGLGWAALLCAALLLGWAWGRT